MKVTIEDKTYRVKWHHRRKYIPVNVITGVDPVTRIPVFKVNAALSARGGVTECELLREDGVGIIGIAHCSKKDNYDKNKGRKQALADALRDFNVPHKPFWDTYAREIGK